MNKFFVLGGYVMSHEEKNRLSYHISTNMSGNLFKKSRRKKKKNGENLGISEWFFD